MTSDHFSVRTTLGMLSDDELELHPAWEATGEVEEGDKVLVPARMTGDGRVDPTVGEVWCRSVCTFANGDVHQACAMYRGDRAEGPLAWTISKNGNELPLLVPPAPPAVLELDGPVPFAKAFNLSLNDIFPLEIKATVKFVTLPADRSVEIGVEGILRRA
jgi:hypothetical protein